MSAGLASSQASVFELPFQSGLVTCHYPTFLFLSAYSPYKVTVILVSSLYLNYLSKDPILKVTSCDNQPKNYEEAWLNSQVTLIPRQIPTVFYKISHNGWVLKKN